VHVFDGIGGGIGGFVIESPLEEILVNAKTASC
jgi:hypothetical protein